MWFRTVFCYALLLFITHQPAAQAQEPPPGAGPGSIARELGLSGDQARRFEAVMETERNAMETLREERKRIQTATREKLASVLNAEQLKQFDEMRASHEPPQRQRGPRPQQPR